MHFTRSLCCEAIVSIDDAYDENPTPVTAFVINVLQAPTTQKMVSSNTFIDVYGILWVHSNCPPKKKDIPGTYN